MESDIYIVNLVGISVPLLKILQHNSIRYYICKHKYILDEHKFFVKARGAMLTMFTENITMFTENISIDK